MKWNGFFLISFLNCDEIDILSMEKVHSFCWKLSSKPGKYCNNYLNIPRTLTLIIIL